MNLLKVAAASAALVYITDPQQGRRRRARLRDQFVRLEHEVSHLVDVATRDATNRLRGAVSTVLARVHPEDVSDEVLEDRVRSAMGHVASNPGAIVVRAEDGIVTLQGSAYARVVVPLLERVRRVRGVRELQNQLDVKRAPEDATSGEPVRDQDRAEMTGYWSPAFRVLMGATGTWLLLRGWRRHGMRGFACTAAGSALLVRAATNHHLREMVGLGPGRGPVKLAKTIHIDAPRKDVYAFWRRLENLPRVLTHLREVRDLGNGRSRWVADGPPGVPVQWEADLVEDIPNELLAWRSTTDSSIEHQGSVRFEREPQGGTRVHIELDYLPPGGMAGHAFATMFGSNPKQQMDDDMVRLKSLLEEGKTTGRRGRVTIESLESAP
jgi:uncharacterized membrane protein